MIGRDFIKKSLGTSDINVARAKRDEILEELLTYESSETSNNFIKLEENSINNQNKINSTESEHIQAEIDTVKANDAISNNFKLNELEMPTKESLIKKIDAFIPITLVIITLIITYLVG